MEKNTSPPRSELVFSGDMAPQNIQWALKGGSLRKIAPRLYTTNLVDPPEEIVRKNAYQIVNHHFPGAVISHRSALEGGPSKEGTFVLTYKYTKNITLPGLTIRLVKGPPADPMDMPFLENLHISSKPRALLENMQSSRGNPHSRKTLSQSGLEEKLDNIIRTYELKEFNAIRDDARKVAKRLNMEKEFTRLDKLMGAILGTREGSRLVTARGRARSRGLPYDASRLELFAALAVKLNAMDIPVRSSAPKTKSERINIAFFEAYFSNYIEGTEFLIEEAEDIIFNKKHLWQRPEDAHDILSTYQLIVHDIQTKKIPTSSEQMLETIKSVHGDLMSMRQEKSPGQFKTIPNRAGNMVFVNPEEVKGTLVKGYELLQGLPKGSKRAIFMMFLVSEVHPFLDGNGRVARIMMNVQLSHTNETRIIIPTVYRDDYLLSLRRLSKDADAEPYVKMLLRAQAFTQSIQFSDYSLALMQLKNAHAFLDPLEGKLNF